MSVMDMLGNFTGYQLTDPAEEERKRREAEEEKQRQEELARQAVQTQKTTTYGDGSRTHTVTTEQPAPGPVMPQQAQAMPIPTNVPPMGGSFQKIRQMESGNRDYTPQGQPVTSPAGAMFASQVMPQTAQNPGFGIQPAQNQTPEEYNRVGQQYFDAMKKRYGGNEELAAAAYHSGPGNVDKALQQAQSTGNDWRSFLGPQGQNYVQKFSGGKLSLQPAGQEQPAQPQAPAAPTVEAPQTQPTEQPYVGQGLMPPRQNQFLQNQDNLDELLRIRQDPNTPENEKKLAGNRAYELMNQNFKMEKANKTVENLIASGDQSAITRVLTSKPKDEDGSWLKFALYGFISPQLAQAEAVKLGIAPTKWEDSSIQGPNGEQIGVQLQRRVDGKVVGGVKADGTPLTSKEIESAQSGLGKHVSTTAETYIDQSGNRYRSQTDERGNARMVNIATGQRFTGDASKLQRQTDVSSMARVDYGLATDLLKKHSGNVLDMMKEYETIKGPMDANARQEFMSRYGYGTTVQPAQRPGMPQQAPAPTQAAPAAPAAGPVSPGVPTQPAPVAPAAPAKPMESIAGLETGVKVGQKQQEEFIKYGSEDITPKADAGSQIARIRREQIKGPDGILNNPELAGLMQGTGGRASEVGNIIRDLITGNFKDQADLSQRVAALNLTDRQKDVLYRQIGLNAQINPLTLRANAGPGAISEAEHKINAQANVDITRQPLYSGLSLMTRDQYNKDLQAYRGEFKSAHPELNTTDSFNRAWSAEKAKLEKQYDGIYAARAEYIAKYNKDGKNPGAVIDAYKHYPVPEWNAETRSWDFGTEFAKKAARPKLNEFVR